MSENVISFNTRKPAAAEELQDPDGVPAELQEAFREAIKSFSAVLEKGETTSLAIATLNIHGGATMFILGETGAEMIGLASMLHHHTMRLMDAAADD